LCYAALPPKVFFSSPEPGATTLTLTTDEQDIQQPQYETPAVTDYGRLAELTAGVTDGCYSDADYPVGTKKSDMGFSGTC